MTKLQINKFVECDSWNNVLLYSLYKSSDSAFSLKVFVGPGIHDPTRSKDEQLGLRTYSKNIYSELAISILLSLPVVKVQVFKVHFN